MNAPSFVGDDDRDALGRPPEACEECGELDRCRVGCPCLDCEEAYWDVDTAIRASEASGAVEPLVYTVGRLAEILARCANVEVTDAGAVLLTGRTDGHATDWRVALVAGGGTR